MKRILVSVLFVLFCLPAYSQQPAAQNPPITIPTATLTVAPGAASPGEKRRADFVGDGVNDQKAIEAAIAVSGTANVAIKCLAGVYRFGATLSIDSTNNFHLGCGDGTIIYGPGGTADTVHINNMHGASLFSFATILHSGTGAAIRVTGTPTPPYHASNFSTITCQNLAGAAHQGKGIFVDGSLGQVTDNRINCGWVHGFDKGIVLDASGTPNYIDSIYVTNVFVWDNNVNIYGRSGTSRRNNANVWNTNVDSFIDRATSVDIDHAFDVFNITWGAQAPHPATTTLLQLRKGANGNVFNNTPNLRTTFASTIPKWFVDESGNSSNGFNISVAPTIGDNTRNHLVKFSRTATGILDDGGPAGALANLNIGENLTSDGKNLSLARTIAGPLAVSGMATTPQANILCYDSGSGAITYRPAAAGCTPSSARFKTLDGVLTPKRALSVVSALAPVFYTYKAEANLGPDRHAGFTAEQVMAVDPQLATKDGVKYLEMVPYLAGAIQALKAENDTLRAANDNLERRLRKLEQGH